MPDATAVIVACACASLALYAVAWLLVMGWAVGTRRRRHGAVPPCTAGLTVLKPLCGADEELERNLASFFDLHHDRLQLVFGAADPADPALDVVRRLVRRHPGRDVAIVVGANPAAASPKVGLLEALLPRAKHPVVLLSDSDVRIRRDDAARVLPAFDDPRVGMVHQPVTGVGERSLPAAIENLHYTEFAGFLSIAVTMLTGQHAVNAKGQWIRRKALDGVDGFRGVRHSGADDYRLGRLVAAAGWRILLAPVPVRTLHRDWSWRSAARRHLRHAALRMRLCPAAYPLELLVNPLPWAALLACVGMPAPALALLGAKAVLEVTAAATLRETPLAWRHAAAIPLKDLAYAAGWFAAFAVRTVSWRDRTYRIVAGGDLMPTGDPPQRIDVAGHAA